jgi:hypothetical protein
MVEALVWISGVVGSAFIGAVVKDLYSSVKKTRLIRKKGLQEGEWVSSYQWVDKPNEWIDEVVDMKVKHGYLAIESNHPSSLYEAKAELVNQEFIKGSYYSKRSGAHETGVFMFAISPGGEMLYGHFIGPTETGERKFAKWVMAKEHSNIESAKAILAKVDGYGT